MKRSYFDTNTNHGSDSLNENNSESDDETSTEFQEPSILSGNGNHPVLAEVESRASVLPLDVPLDETEDSPMDDEGAQCPEPLDNKPKTSENKIRRTKKKDMEERCLYL